MKSKIKNTAGVLLIAVIFCVAFVACEAPQTLTPDSADVGQNEEQAAPSSEPESKPIQEEESISSQAKTLEDFSAYKSETEPIGQDAVLYDGWVYYASASKGGLFKMREDGTDVSKVSDDYPVWEICVYDEWVYYTHTPKRNISYLPANLYRIRTDGTDKEMLIESCNMYFISNDSLYYEVSYFYEQGYMYNIMRAEPNGKGAIALPIRGKIIDIIGDFLYYLHDDAIWRVLLEGGGSEMICEYHTAEIFKHEEWLYFHGGFRGNYSGETGIFRMKPDGSELSLYVEATSSFSLFNEYLYVQDSAQELNRKEITKISLNTGEKSVIKIDAVIIGFEVIGDWIYFTNNSEFFNNWRVRLDGTDMQEL